MELPSFLLMGKLQLFSPVMRVTHPNGCQVATLSGEGNEDAVPLFFLSFPPSLILFLFALSKPCHLTYTNAGRRFGSEGLPRKTSTS